MSGFKHLYLFYVVVFSTFALLAFIYHHDIINIIFIRQAVFSGIAVLVAISILSRLFKVRAFTPAFRGLVVALAGFLFSGILFLVFARISI